MIDRSFKKKQAVLALLVAAIILVHAPKCFSSPSNSIDWLLLCDFVSCLLMAIVPIVLANVLPRLADFRRQWFPDALSQWAWFVLLVASLYLIDKFTFRITALVGLTYKPSSFVYGTLTWTRITLFALLSVFLYPIAEEIFWRGYVLEQLRKVTPSGVAIVIQAALFSAAHLIGVGWVHSILAFWGGVLLGSWRVRFRSLLPLTLAHILVNLITGAPLLMILYQSEPMFAKPKIQRMNSLALQPISNAAPTLVGFLSDADDDVRNYASAALLRYPQSDLQPYLRKAVVSENPRTLDAVLFVINMGHYSGLRDEVRGVAWSANDSTLQLSAVTTLEAIDDLTGLDEIAKRHPNAATRGAARRMVIRLEENMRPAERPMHR